MSELLKSLLMGLVLSVLIAGCNDSRHERVAEDYCQNLERCDPVNFADTYDSQRECATLHTFVFGAASSQYGKACARRTVDLYDCLGGVADCQASATECLTEAAAADEACDLQQNVENPCPGYVAGTDSDFCCQTDDPCDWAGDNFCDCGDTCSWDTGDCSGPP